MTREDIKRIMVVISTTYPSWKPEDKTATIDLWTALFNEYPKEVIEQATLNYIRNDVKGFAPSPGQIINFIDTGKNFLNEEEAWDTTYKAICRSGDIDYAVKEFERLPELCKKAIGSPNNLRNLALLDTNSVLTVEKSHFMRVYRTEVEKKSTFNRTAEGLKMLSEVKVECLADKEVPKDPKVPKDPERLPDEQVDYFMAKLKERLKI